MNDDYDDTDDRLRLGVKQTIHGPLLALPIDASLDVFFAKIKGIMASGQAAFSRLIYSTFILMI